MDCLRFEPPSHALNPAQEEQPSAALLTPLGAEGSVLCFRVPAFVGCDNIHTQVPGIIFGSRVLYFINHFLAMYVLASSFFFNVFKCVISNGENSLAGGGDDDVAVPLWVRL